MSTYDVTKEWLKENGHKLKMAYSFAVENKLNIESKEDVLKVLQKVDPENATEEQVEIYSKMLLLFRERFRETLKKALEE